MIEVRYNLNMVPDKGSPIHINVSQNDDKCRTFIFKLYSSDGSWTAPASATATIEGRKDDGKFFSFACTYSNGEVTVVVQQQMVAVAGKVRCKLKLVSGAETIESAPFYFVVNPKSMPVNADMSKSDVVDAVAKATQKIVDQVAGSIPQDYVKLNEDVSGLKSDLSEHRKVIGFKNILNPNEIKIDYGIPAVVVNATPINANPSNVANVAISGIMQVHPGDTVNVRMLHTGSGRIMLAKSANGVVTRTERTVENQTDYSIQVGDDEHFLRLQMRSKANGVSDVRAFAMVTINTQLEQAYVEFGAVSINRDVDIQKLNKTLQSPWNGKVCACLGTSLTANGGWIDVLKERFGFSKVYNRGSGGTTLANYSQDGFSDYVTSITVYNDEAVWDEARNTCYYTGSDIPQGYENYTHTSHVSAWYSAEARVNTLPTDADLVLIDIGTNDWFRIRTGLGWNERLNIPQINTPYRQKQNPPIYDDKKMGDSFVLLIQRVKARCPNAKIVVWGMMYNSSLCTYNPVTSEPSEDMDTWLRMINYVDVLCKKFGIRYVDIAHEAGINVFNLEEYCEDGIHPYKPTYTTEKGKYAVANVLTEHLQKIFPKDYK